MNPSTATICDCRYDFETGVVLTVQTTWKPTTAGILDIFAGILYIFWSYISWSYYASCEPSYIERMKALLVLMHILLAVIGGLAVVVGGYALKRKKWRVTLIGSICVVLGSLGILVKSSITSMGLLPAFALPGILFIPAIILTALSKNEFE